MRAEILNDSEDEEQDLLSGSSGSARSAFATSFDQRSTGSTERLKKAIISAERGLRTNLPEDAVSPGMSLTATRTKLSSLKRSQSDVGSDDTPSQALDRALKRAKSSRAALEIGFEESHSSRNRDIYDLPSSAGSAHPGLRTLTATTGDTIAFTEHTQEQIIAMLARPRATLSPPLDATAKSRMQSDSRDSSFPWTAHGSGSVANPSASVDLSGNNPQLASQQSVASSKVQFSQVSLPNRTNEMIEQCLDLQSRQSSPDVLAHNVSSAPKKRTPRAKQADLKQVTSQAAEDELAIVPQAVHSASKSTRRSSRAQQSGLKPRVEPTLQSPNEDLAASNTHVAQTSIDHGSTVPSGSQPTSSIIVVGKAKSDSNANELRSQSASDAVHAICVHSVTISRDAVTNPTRDLGTAASLLHEETTSAVPLPNTKKSATKTAKGKKAKRSHTTIFEDHVQLKPSQESLTLSQQQAQRKIALQEVSNPSQPQSRARSRRKVIQEDADDKPAMAEDSSEMPNATLLPAVSEVDGPTPVSPSTKAIEEPIDKELKEPTTEKTSTLKALLDNSSNQRRSTRPEAASEKNKDIFPLTSTPEERGAANASPTSPQQAASAAVKSSPIIHSPIRVTIGKLHRVGLSKRQRIPSLLKTIRTKK